MSEQQFLTLEHFVNSKYGSQNSSVIGKLFPFLSLSVINGNYGKRSIRLFLFLTCGVVCCRNIFFRAFFIIAVLGHFTYWQKNLFYLPVQCLYFIFLTLLSLC